MAKWFTRAYRRFPSITKATCLGIGPVARMLSKKFLAFVVILLCSQDQHFWSELVMGVCVSVKRQFELAEKQPPASKICSLTKQRSNNSGPETTVTLTTKARYTNSHYFIVALKFWIRYIAAEKVPLISVHWLVGFRGNTRHKLLRPYDWLCYFYSWIQDPSPRTENFYPQKTGRKGILVFAVWCVDKFSLGFPFSFNAMVGRCLIGRTPSGSPSSAEALVLNNLTRINLGYAFQINFGLLRHRNFERRFIWMRNCIHCNFPLSNVRDQFEP